MKLLLVTEASKPFFVCRQGTVAHALLPIVRSFEKPPMRRRNSRAYPSASSCRSSLSTWPRAKSGAAEISSVTELPLFSMDYGRSIDGPYFVPSARPCQ